MAQKKYQFSKILKEYNKVYDRDYRTPSKTANVIIVHDIGINSFYVTSTDVSGIQNERETLHDFLHYRVSNRITWSTFEQIMLDKEAKKSNLKIEIWPPSKIRYAYLHSNYFACIGNLGSSCMRSKEMQRALNFYVKNNVRIVVVIDNDNKIHARALLWDNIKSTKLKKPFIYLDRVYAKSDALCSSFYDLAEENKWKRYPSTTVNQMSKTYYKEDIVVAGMCHLPFNDTFRYLYFEDNLLTSGNGLGINKKADSYITLDVHNNCAYYPMLDPNKVQEAITGKNISKKDAIFVKRYEGNYDGYVLKEHIANINDVFYSIHDNEIVKTIYDEYILKENSVNEVITNYMIDKTIARYSDKYKGHIHESNVVCIQNEIYHKKDTNIICFEDNWYHISQCFINYDREKRNIALSKKKFHFWIEDEVFVPYPDDFVVRKDNLIPKERAIIAYNLIYSPVLDDIEYQELYRTNMGDLVQLTTGELIVSSTSNRKYLKKFNNKWYIKQASEILLSTKGKVFQKTQTTCRDFKLPNKKQLMFSFMSATDGT